MSETTTRTEVTVTCDMEADLAYAGIGPRFSDRYYRAERSLTARECLDCSGEQDSERHELFGPAGQPGCCAWCGLSEDQYLDIARDEMERLGTAHDALITQAAEAWAASAERIGAEMGYEVEAIVTRDESVLRSAQTKTWTGPETEIIYDDIDEYQVPLSRSDDETVEHEIWQAAHDAIAVDEADGTWTVEAR